MLTIRFALFVVVVAGMTLLPRAAPGQAAEYRPICDAPGEVLWYADHEEGSLIEWTDDGFEHAGGGVFTTGAADVAATASTDVAHWGQWSAKTVIQNAFRAQNGSRAVRLMRWTDRAWDDGGRFFPNEAYYSAWIYFPHVYNPNKQAPWDPGDGGWWNVFQFKSEDVDGVSQPVWSINVGCDQQGGQMFLYLYSQRNSPFSYQQFDPLPVPARKWVHVEAYYRSAASGDGRIRIWQDGEEIFDVDGVITSLGGVNGADTHPIWGIGSYTDHINGDPAGEGTATVYFDDAVISTGRMFPLMEASF